MKILSLFDGISCARVAAERAGFSVEKYYASEIDKYAIKVAMKNYPDTMQLGDVRGITKEMVVDIDLLIGGSPCQDLSIAKKDRKGLDGERSGLFYEYVRILKEVKPKWFILENVYSMPKEAVRTITAELFEIEPVMINAALVSAQNRKRLFWVGELFGDIYKSVWINQPEDLHIMLKDILEDNPDIAPLKSKTIRSSGRASGISDRHNWDSIKVGHINDSDSQGNRVYSEEGKSVALSANGGGLGAKTGLYKINETVRKLAPIECERLQGLPDNYTDGISNTQRYKCLGNAFNVDVVAHILRQIKEV